MHRDLLTPKSKGQNFGMAPWASVWSFMTIGLREKALSYVQEIIFITNVLWSWPFNPEIDRTHPWLIGNLCVKFHYYTCKGKAVMCRKRWSVINALWPWPVDPEIDRTHHWIKVVCYVPEIIFIWKLRGSNLPNLVTQLPKHECN